MKSQKKSRRKKNQVLLNLFLDNYSHHSSFAEAFRTLRTNISYSFIEKEFRSLLITSSVAGEGKTITVANLAYTMAGAGKSVLMIDADMRMSSLSPLVPSDGSPGLTGLLSDTFGTDIQTGSLNQMGIHDLFTLLSLQNRTGLLHLSEGTEKVEIFFLHGKMVDLNWVTRPSEKRLARILVQNNLITQEQLRHALARQKSSGQKIGFILISMGLVKEDDLTGFLTIHMMEGLRIALQFKEGKFSFQKVPEADFDKASFDPVDFPKIYNQVVIGEKELRYLKEKINSAILKTDVPNLSLLPVGHLPPNPSELLSSDRMSFLMSNLKKRFDIIIIDSPPVLPASDALILAPQTDGVALVIKSGFVNREMVKKTVENLKLAHANLLGIVFSQVDMEKDGFYKYHSGYYGSEH